MTNNWIGVVLVIFSALISITACRTSNQHIYADKLPDLNKSGSHYVVAYVAGWSTVGVSTLNAAKLTHINYAFANVDANGRVYFENLGDPYNNTLLIFHYNQLINS